MFTAMKRYLILLAAVALLAACNKNNDEVQSPTQSTTPKRLASITDISYTQGRSRDNITGEYVLLFTSGSKSTTTMRWSSAGLLVSYGKYGQDDLITIEYNGDKISRIAFSDIMNDDGITDVACTYTGDNLTEIFITKKNGWTKKILSYNSKGELITSRSETFDGDVEETTLVWEDGNVKSETTTHTSSRYSYSSTWTIEYLYDNKISYYTGMGNYTLIKGEGYHLLSRNNVLRATLNGESTTVFTYTYDGDWPVTVSTADNNNYSASESTSYLRYTDGSGATVPQTYRIDAKSNMPDNHSLYVMGSGDYEAGRQVVLRASTSIADTGFVCWNDGITDNPRTFTVTGDAEYIAVFNAINNK